jgi:hypothetical protein
MPPITEPLAILWPSSGIRVIINNKGKPPGALPQIHITQTLGLTFRFVPDVAAECMARFSPIEDYLKGFA